MLSHQNITKQVNTATNMNKEGVKHAREANIIDRFEIKGTGNSFITLKDHKKNF